MFIVHGTRLFGKVDEVPGMYHVATKFFHVYYVPVIPMGSQIVLSKSGKKWQGVPIGLSLKSVFAAWLRVASVVGLVSGVGLVLTAADGSGPDHPPMSMAIGVLAGSGAALYWSYRVLCRASYKRAHQLADRLQMDHDAQLRIDVALGLISREELDAALAGQVPPTGDDRG